MPALARMLHDGSLRHCAGAKRDGHADARARKTKQSGVLVSPSLSFPDRHSLFPYRDWNEQSG